MKSSLTHRWAGAHRLLRAEMTPHFTQERKHFIRPQQDKQHTLSRHFLSTLPVWYSAPTVNRGRRPWGRGGCRWLRLFCPGCLWRCRPASSALFCLGATMEPCCPCLVHCVLSGKKACDKAPSCWVRLPGSHTHSHTVLSHLLSAAHPALCFFSLFSPGG